MTIIRVTARNLRPGDRYTTPTGIRTVISVWRPRDAHLFAGSRARVEIVRARVSGLEVPEEWGQDTVLTVERPGTPLPGEPGYDADLHSPAAQDGAGHDF